MKRTTLSELGATLPVGTFRDGKFFRHLAIRKWRMEEERELGKFRKDGVQTAAQYTSVVLSYMLTSFGIHTDFQALSEAERRLAINQAPMADILYTWVWMRVQALDSTLLVNLACPSPNCGHKFDWKGDLESMDVDVAQGPEDLAIVHTLRDGIEIGKKTIHTITIVPPLWATYEQVRREKAGDMGMGEMKRMMLRSAIRDTPEIEAFVLTEEHLDSLSKYDLERCVGVLEKRSPGPELVLDASCPSCESEFQHALDWQYDSFFGSSSLWPEETA